MLTTILVLLALGGVTAECLYTPDASGHAVVPEAVTSIVGCAFFHCYSLTTFKTYVFGMRAATDILPAGRAGRRLNAKDSLMVHWDRPTVSATSRHHKLRLPLLLEMVQNHPQNQLSQQIYNLLPG